MSLSNNLLFPLTTPLVSLLVASGLDAQIKIRGRLVPAGGSTSGVRVEMFESANLDRFLRSAQSSLSKEDYEHAIKVLQEVIEGRTGEFMAELENGDTPAKDPKKNQETPKPKTLAGNGGPIDEEDPAYSVFSSDGRIYRPVSRLCHELLASMPPAGIGLYRIKYEAQAERDFAAAAENSDLVALEAVYNHHFVTLSSARAMQLASDLLMDAGRFRAAIQTLENLLGVYPTDGRREAGIQDLILMVKVAICYQQLGELEMAREQIDLAAEAFPEASVRLMGELHTVKEMRAGELFDVASQVETAVRAHAQALDLVAAKGLTSMWEYRFTEIGPYTSKKSSSGATSRPVRVNRPAGSQIHGTYFPRHRKNIPGTTVMFQDGKLVFLDSFRPLVHDLLSGRQLLAMGDPELAEYKIPRSSAVPRSRTPLYDYFGNRVAGDFARYYFLEGYNRSATTASFRAIHTNSLHAYDRQTGKQVWECLSKVGKARTITYLATPTVYRTRLLVPFLETGTYGVLCLQASTGDEIYRTYLHSGGTAFARAPSPQVVVESGIAYVMTNAGVLGAVDANTGALNWARKYERVHPTRGKRPTKSRGRIGNPFANYATAQFGDFKGFVPGDLHVVGDLILLAAADSTVLLCLNAASGEILWMMNAERPRTHNVLTSRLSYIVGRNDDFLFVMCGESRLVCVGLRSGLRYWIAKLPGLDREGWRGRGFVTPDYVVLPGRAGSRQIHVVPANSKREPVVQTLDLPSFSIGKEPLSGPVNLQVHDAYLAVNYEGGVEIYSSPSALESLANTSASIDVRASYLVHANRLDESVEILYQSLDKLVDDSKSHRRVAIRVLSLVEELSAKLAAKKQGKAALEILDQCEKRMRDPRLVLRVHLFRLQVYRALGDLEGVEREQEYIENGGVK